MRASLFLMPNDSVLDILRHMEFPPTPGAEAYEDGEFVVGIVGHRREEDLAVIDRQVHLEGTIDGFCRYLLRERIAVVAARAVIQSIVPH